MGWPVVSGSRDRTRGNDLNLHQGWLKLDIRKSFISEAVVGCWNWLPREVMESQSLGSFKNCKDVALKDMV